VLSSQSDAAVAVAAVDGSVFAGLERDFGVFAALGAYCLEHLPPTSEAAIAAAFGLPGSAAIGTAPGLVLQAARRVEFLLTGGEGEFLPTISALEGLVLKAHWMTSSLQYFWFELRSSST